MSDLPVDAIQDCQICTNGQPEIVNIGEELHVECPRCLTAGPLCKNKGEAISHWNNLNSYNSLKERIRILDQAREFDSTSHQEVLEEMKKQLETIHQLEMQNQDLNNYNIKLIREIKQLETALQLNQH